MKGHGEIFPELPLGRLGRLLKGYGGTKSESLNAGLPCVRYGDLYTRHKEFITGTASFISREVSKSYFRVRKGDVLFAASGETVEDIGRSSEVLLEDETYCGGDLIVFRPNVHFAPKFLGYSVDSSNARGIKAQMGRGYTVVHIYPSELKRLPVPVPPVRLQRHIVAFLDRETARIDELVREQEQMSSLMNERYGALLREVVTRGLDRTEVTKPSGIPWVPEIPSHWSVEKLGWRYEVALGKMLDSSRSGGGRQYAYLRNQDVQWGRVNFEDLPTFRLEPDEVERYTVKRGDILVCEGGDVGRAALWTGPDGEIAFQKALHRLRPRNRLRDVPEYLFHLLMATKSAGAYEQNDRKATISHLTAEAFRELRLPFPPLEEQAEALEFLNHQLEQTSILQGHIASSGGSLRERRSALITAAVTGQLDLSDWRPPDDAALGEVA